MDLNEPSFEQLVKKFESHCVDALTIHMCIYLLWRYVDCAQWTLWDTGQKPSVVQKELERYNQAIHCQGQSHPLD